MTKKNERARVGLVELNVSPRAGAPGDRFEAVGRAAREAASERRRAVERVLKDPATARLDVIVFPGWTLAGLDVPKSVLAASGERVVVLETLGSPRGRRGARYPWTTWAVWRGEVVAHARQLFATAAEASDDVVSRLAEELAGQRTFAHPTLGRVALLVCGEPNVVREHAAPALPALDTILNPAHTPSRLPAMQRKRARLAARGRLFTTANTHDGWTPRGGRAQPASRQAAEWFQRGVRGARPEATELLPGARLSVVEIAV